MARGLHGFQEAEAIVRPSEVRQHVLGDHRELRKRLEILEGLVRQVLDGERRLAGPLRNQAEALLTRLLDHMRWEDRYLSAALREADAWGQERAAALDHEHREQREILGEAVTRLRDEARPAQRVARELSDLIQRLRADMEEEERDLLDERVLRDDVIGIDVEAG
jgi:hypothetical protein